MVSTNDGWEIFAKNFGLSSDKNPVTKTTLKNNRVENIHPTKTVLLDCELIF